MEPPGKKYRFQKQEKLCSEKQISVLFQQGKWARAENLRVRYLIREEEQFVYPRILISVPRKIIRRATARNRIKRQLREAYRLNKEALVEAASVMKKEVILAVIFSGEKGLEYHQLEKDMKKLLNKVLKDING